MNQVRRLLLATTSILLAAAAPAALAATTERVSVKGPSHEADQPSFIPSISGDGRLVTFTSAATNLATIDPASLQPVFGGFPPCCNVYLRDRTKRKTVLLDVSSDGTPGNLPALFSFIADNGLVAAFGSAGNNLVATDTNGKFDTFARDLKKGRTVLVSVGNAGQAGDAGSLPAANGISPGGRLVAFFSNSSTIVPATGAGHLNLYLRDLERRTTDVLTVGPHGEPGDASPSTGPFDGINAAISDNERLVAFDSSATNLVTGDTNAHKDVFLRDRRARRTKLVSVAANGGQADGDSLGPFIAAGGGTVAFSSAASNLVSGQPDTNGFYDAYLRDRAHQTTTRLSHAAGGGETDGDTFVLNMSADARLVLLWSTATNLIANTTTSGAQVFLLDRHTGKVKLVSVSASGQAGNGPADSTYGDLSHNGAIDVFGSEASNLVQDDSNGAEDIFARVLNGGSGPDIAAPPASGPRSASAARAQRVARPDASGVLGAAAQLWN